MAKVLARSRGAELFARLRLAYPGAHCELVHNSPFELLVAVVLSAQATDVSVNRITPALFRRYPDARVLGAADPKELEHAIQSIGMFRQKARNLVALARQLTDQHAAQVPCTLAELVALPGVGRKTANVVLGVAFGRPEGVVVDTHVLRVSQRLGLTRHQKPEEVEQDLMRAFPPQEWDLLGHTLIFHGRRVCAARRPACAACPVSDLCPSAFHAEAVGRKRARRAAVGRLVASAATRSRVRQRARASTQGGPKRKG